MLTDWMLTPAFARLADYVGLWSMEACAAASLFQLARSMNLGAHIAEAPVNPPLLSLLEKIPAAETGKSIAVVRLSGILMKGQTSMGGTSTVQARRDVRQAAADPEVSGILLAIDSPGGTVSGTDDLAQDVRAAGRRKPVVAQIEDLGASAAYWVASQASAVYANSPTALVGSIGTYQVIQDYSEAAARDGIRTLVFATGSLKGLGTPGTKVTEEQAAHVQSLVDAVQSSFDAAVQRGRGLSNRQLADVRHGGVLTATAALEAKLIDGIQPLSKTLAEMASAGKPTASQRATGSIPMVSRHGLPTVRN